MGHDETPYLQNLPHGGRSKDRELTMTVHVQPPMFDLEGAFEISGALWPKADARRFHRLRYKYRGPMPVYKIGGKLYANRGELEEWKRTTVGWS